MIMTNVHIPLYEQVLTLVISCPNNKNLVLAQCREEVQGTNCHPFKCFKSLTLHQISPIECQ